MVLFRTRGTRPAAPRVPCQTGAVDFADALAADELWGWPVEILDRLRSYATWPGMAASLEEWREQDAAHRARLPVVDADEVQEFQHEWLLNGSRDVPEDARGRLTGRLTVLAHPAPSDEELWDELSSLHEVLADPRRNRRSEEIYQMHRDRVAAWLTRGRLGYSGAGCFRGLAERDMRSRTELTRATGHPGALPGSVIGPLQHPAWPSSPARTDVQNAAIEPGHGRAVLIFDALDLLGGHDARPRRTNGRISSVVSVAAGGLGSDHLIVVSCVASSTLTAPPRLPSYGGAHGAGS